MKSRTNIATTIYLSNYAKVSFGKPQEHQTANRYHAAHFDFAGAVGAIEFGATSRWFDSFQSASELVGVFRIWRMGGHSGASSE
jgi:hypothetical protein